LPYPADPAWREDQARGYFGEPEEDRGEPAQPQGHEEQIVTQLDILLFLLGSGQGGSIVLTYALHHPEGLTGVVALNPASEQQSGRSLLARLSHTLSQIWPRFAITTPIDYSSLPAERGPEQAAASGHPATGTAGVDGEDGVAAEQLEIQSGDLSIPHLILRGGDYDPVLVELERWLASIRFR
jgi:pimeloyl-ACP methyl ester carboxylesterase